MAPNPQIIMINDRNDAFQTLRRASENSNFLLNAFLAKPIVPEVDKSILIAKGMREKDVISFESAKEFLGSDQVPRQVICLLDLNLEFFPEMRMELRQEFDIPPNIFDHFIDGTVLALLAIDNPRVDKIMIYISSTWGSLGDLFEFLEQRIVTSGLQGRYLFDEGNLEVPYSVTKTELILQTVLEAWEKIKCGWRFCFDELGRGLINLHLGPAPFTIEAFPDGFFLKAILRNEQSSFKGLFLLSESEDQSVCVSVFVEVLRKFGISLGVKAELGELGLPISPGVLFILNLINFLKTYGQNQISLEIRGGHCQLGFKVPEPDKFESAIYFSGKDSTGEAFRNLLFCSSAILKPMVVKSEHWNIISTSWPPRPFKDQEGFPILLDWKLKGTTCILSWGSQLK